MIKDKIKSNKAKSNRINRELDINIVNGLELEIDCQIELYGNKLTIWINKSEK